MSALSAVLSTRVERRRKFGEFFCTECTIQANDFELISKFCSERFHRDTDPRVVFKFREICEIVRCLPDKKKQHFAWLSNSRDCMRGSRPKPARASPDNVLRVIQISSKSVHFRRSYSRTREHRQNAP